MNARAHAMGLVATLVGAPATLGLVLALNRAVAGPPQDTGPRDVTFQVQTPPPKPKPKPEEPQRQQRPAPRNAPRVALPAAPSLGAELSGVDVGLSTFAYDALDTVPDEALGDLSDVVHTEETVDSRPQPRVTTPIDVPAAARARNLSGRVVLSVRIGSDGRVKALKVLESEPPGVFEDAVLAAVRGWEFAPATYRDRPVEVWATLPIEFQP